MICDEIKNIALYANCHQQFTDVATFIAKTDLLNLANGKHFINEKGAFASVNEYTTKPQSECFVECHQKYIDVQMLVYGEELIGYSPVSSCEALPYDAEKDLQKLVGEVSFIHIKTGMFAIFFPHDAHMPNVLVATPLPVKKIVFKIPCA
jgi:YhcH/YjgK/YiaL family protein